jgi:antitoxin (DNA-binding transcriptional repressor) of toxin-antitoxin stability system
MVVISITKAKKQFYELFYRAKNGEIIIITKWGKQVATLKKPRNGSAT